MDKKKFEACKRKNKYKNRKEAREKAQQIKEERRVTLREYKCEVCLHWHLTKMAKKQYRYQNDTIYRQSVNEKSFVNKEVEYYKKKFGIED